MFNVFPPGTSEDLVVSAICLTNIKSGYWAGSTRCIIKRKTRKCYVIIFQFIKSIKEQPIFWLEVSEMLKVFQTKPPVTMTLQTELQTTLCVNKSNLI